MHLGLEFQRKNQYPRDLILHPRESLSVSVSLSVCLCLSLCSNLQLKQRALTLTFSAQIWPKMDLRLEIQKTNVTIKISILEKPCVRIFRQNEQLWLFRLRFAQKLILGLEFQKSKFGFGIPTSKIPSVPISSQNGQVWIFRPKFGEIAQVRYFGSNNIEGVAESWVETEMSGVEVDRAGWELKWTGRSWVELGGAGWSWVNGLVILKYMDKSFMTIGHFSCYHECHISRFWKYSKVSCDIKTG